MAICGRWLRFGLGVLALLTWAIGIAATGPSPPGAVAASVGAETILRASVESTIQPEIDRAQADRDAQLRQLDFELAQKRAKIIESEVERLLNERVLALESAASHSSRDELLGKAKARAVTDDEVLGFYQARRQEINQPLPNVRSQIRELLEQQARAEATSAYLKGLRAKYHAVSRIEPLRIPVDADGPAQGPSMAPVTMIEFADFQCPYCARMEPVLEELRAAYPKELRIVFRHLPLSSLHPLALPAARGAVCADQQGHFWEMHDALFRDQSALAEEALKVTARRIGLDGDAFDQCLKSDASEARVNVDNAAAEAIGLGGTPAFFINGRFFGGTAPANAFKAIIDDELARRHESATARAARR